MANLYRYTIRKLDWLDWADTKEVRTSQGYVAANSYTEAQAKIFDEYVYVPSVLTNEEAEQYVENFSIYPCMNPLDDEEIKETSNYDLF